MQRADWQRTCERAAIFSGGKGRGSGGKGWGIVVPGVNYKDKAEQREEKGEGSRGERRQAATWPSALGVIYALLMQIFAEAGEWEQGEKGDSGAGSWAFNRSMDRCIDLAMPARAIDQLEKSRSEAIPTEPK